MKKIFKTIAWVLLIAFVAIQFFHPKKNIAQGDQPNAFAKLHPVADDVKAILKKACDDCHTNNTVYPWYSKVQPVDWWMDNHIVEGKRKFNLDELGKAPIWRRYDKMKDVVEQVKENEMPLNSYTWIHKNAILSDDEKAKLTGWAQGIMSEMEAKFPADSLKRPKRPEQPKP
jgi:Haem-binding domain